MARSSWRDPNKAEVAKTRWGTQNWWTKSHRGKKCFTNMVDITDPSLVEEHLHGGHDIYRSVPTGTICLCHKRWDHLANGWEYLVTHKMTAFSMSSTSGRTSSWGKTQRNLTRQEKWRDNFQNDIKGVAMSVRDKGSYLNSTINTNKKNTWVHACVASRTHMNTHTRKHSHDMHTRMHGDIQRSQANNHKRSFTEFKGPEVSWIPISYYKNFYVLNLFK